MLRFLIAGLLAAGALCSAPAQAADAAQIIVMGAGSVERPADWAGISLSVSGEGKTTTEVLKAMTDLQARLESQLNALVGTTAVQIQTSELKVTAVRNATCDNGERYRPKPTLTQGDCAVAGFIASMAMTVRVAPASRIGDIGSLAAELGGSELELAGFGLNAPAELEDAATKAAIENARAQAEAIAKASGVRLGPIIRVQDPSTMDYDGGRGAGFRLQPRPAARRPQSVPTVSVTLTVPPVRESARLAVVFSVLP